MIIISKTSNECSRKYGLNRVGEFSPSILGQWLFASRNGRSGRNATPLLRNRSTNGAI